MPELPEVETIRGTLERLVLKKQIEDVSIFWPKIIQHPDDSEQFRMLLQNETIERIGRRGKFLIFYLTNYVLISHLRMEGKYRVVPSSEEKDKHTHIIFHFTDGSDLRYNDVRKFGTMHVYPIGDEFVKKPLKDLGPDPFTAEYSIEYLEAQLMKTTRFIKAALLDQTIIAGLGNIYVDEVLFLSKVHPEKRANMLSKEEIALIYENAKIVLDEAVKLGGTTIRSYVNGQGEMGMFQQQLYAYGQTGKPCIVCSTAIKKIKVAGRGTHICPKCQVL